MKGYGKTKGPVPHNAVEEFIFKYDPNLKDESIQEMVAFRKKENPAFRVVDPTEWDLKPYGVSYALISMLIKENKNQTASELAESLSKEKHVSFTSAAYVVNRLLNAKHLFYYDDHFTENQIVHIWTPTIVIKKSSVA